MVLTYWISRKHLHHRSAIVFWSAEKLNARPLVLRSVSLNVYNSYDLDGDSLTCLHALEMHFTSDHSSNLVCRSGRWSKVKTRMQTTMWYVLPNIHGIEITLQLFHVTCQPTKCCISTRGRGEVCLRFARMNTRLFQNVFDVHGWWNVMSCSTDWK